MLELEHCNRAGACSAEMLKREYLRAFVFSLLERSGVDSLQIMYEVQTQGNLVRNPLSPAHSTWPGNGSSRANPCKNTE